MTIVAIVVVVVVVVLVVGSSRIGISGTSGILTAPILLCCLVDSMAYAGMIAERASGRVLPA